MNPAKLDAALAAALQGALDPPAARLTVFVHVEPGAAETDREAFPALGIALPERGSVCTATLSADEIADLSEHPWVRRIALAQPLDLLGHGEG